jgi:hypothetical protein
LEAAAKLRKVAEAAAKWAAKAASIHPHQTTRQKKGDQEVPDYGEAKTKASSTTSGDGIGGNGTCSRVW